MKTVRKRPRKIAVPTDFSLGSTSAMVYALALGKIDGSTVTAVHVIDPFDYSFGPKDLAYLKKRQVWAQAEDAMSQWLKSNKFSACATTMIEGEAGPAIAQFIEREGIDLAVLGTSTRGHVTRLLLGSVAEEIFREANCVVLVLGPKVRTRRQQLARLVFATDLEPHSLAAFSRLSKIARDFASTVTVIRAVHPDIRSREERRRIRAETELKIEAAADPSLRKRMKEIHVEFGEPAKVIAKFANTHRFDAIVLGIRSGGDWTRARAHIPWTFAHRVIANARCPVLTIRG
jgi:nucleotide-binding universal stress UspA family protein